METFYLLWAKSTGWEVYNERALPDLKQLDCCAFVRYSVPDSRVPIVLSALARFKAKLSVENVHPLREGFENLIKSLEEKLKTSQ